MKIYRDTITHYRRNKLDDHAACGDDLIGRRNEDQLDPFNTTCRNCLVSTGRHHSTFQNLSNYFALTLGKNIKSIDTFCPYGDSTKDSFHKHLQIEFVENRQVDCFEVWFDHKWALDNINLTV
ncbi:hypothetical protein FDG92_gp53 [Arthrobacter phage Jasmine]|uniref:Uncharacterized protein n=1 Tax=Arthrobacter phage Jasmine TaxID=1772302 RepID=A0A0U4K057_9CAUD|nr:hypothetical protein FDG92_gp53 [Arthrobacter phage Jasmine]ALY09324.1 hypothetical protein JASMINE_54 [Arthrobacter phage Jasmine]